MTAGPTNTPNVMIRGLAGASFLALIGITIGLFWVNLATRLEAIPEVPLTPFRTLDQNAFAAIEQSHARLPVSEDAPPEVELTNWENTGDLYKGSGRRF